jgi:hypothetical protein
MTAVRVIEAAAASRGRAVGALWTLGWLVLSLYLPSAAAAQVSETQLNENCTVSVLNRNVRVRPDGSWVLPNVPANFGPVRARVTCVVDGRTISGESEPFLVPANGVANRPRIIFGQTTPIPRSVTVTAPVATLTEIGATVQLTVTARYADGTSKDVTAAGGTQYQISNAAIATVSASGRVQAQTAGTVVIQAALEGASGMTSIRVAPAGADSDGDGLPDEYELARGLNPNNAVDAQEDPDHDGLTNLQEFEQGTDPRNADTDLDSLSDGQEIARGTNPLLWDTDSDGVSDGLETQAGTNPLDRTSVDFGAALNSIAVTPASFLLSYNTVVGEASIRLTVTGTMRDGRPIDLTARGVNYASSDVNVCNFGATSGQVFAGQSGICTITASLATFSDTSAGSVRTFSPTALGSIAIPGYANNVDVNGSVAYVAAGGAGLVVVDAADPASPAIVGSFNTTGNANDVRVVGNRAYVADGPAGLQIMDVSNPAAPVLLGTIDTPGQASDVVVSGSLAYVADGAAGLQIIDVSNAAAPAIIRSIAIVGTTRGVDINAQTVVVVVDGARNVLHVIDVTNPTTAVIAGTVAVPGQPTDVSLGNGYAYVAAYTGGMSVVDVRQPKTPVIVGGLPGSAPNGFVPRDVQVAGQFAIFAEQLFANAVAPIVDVSQPATPRFRGLVDFRQDYAGTGIAVSGPFIYWTGQSFVVGDENGVSGQTKLFIGQYLAHEDAGGAPPQVRLTAPAGGSELIVGESLSVRATATDDVAVVSVTFTVDGEEVFVDTSEPYEYTFVGESANGAVTLSAVAIDLAGNTGTAEGVTIAVIADPLTTVRGRVVDGELQPIAGVNVSVLGQTAVSASDGTFSIAGLPTLRPALLVTATLSIDNTVLIGTSAPAPPVRGGITDVGDIVVTATAFENNLGTLYERCDHCDLTVPVGFAFPISGTTHDRIHINNGYLRTDGGDELKAFCCNLTLTENGGGGGGEVLAAAADAGDQPPGLYVNDQIPGRLVVTWFKHFTQLTGAELNTIQVILFADGRIQYGYREVSPRALATVGLFPRERFTVTRLDFRTAAIVAVAPREVVYEDFAEDGNRFDLGGGFVTFTPSGDGGYEIRPVRDVAPPVCIVTNPVDGSTLFEGEPVAIEATATDNGSVSRVTFTSSVGGLDATVSTPPFRVPFIVPVGVTGVTFNVTAYDSWGNAGACVATATVVPGPPPTAVLSVPPGVLTAGATIPITVDATNRVPVGTVDLRVNGVTLSSDATAPFEFLFTVPAGVTSLTLSASANDSVGKNGSSADVSATVVADPLTTVQGRVVDRLGAPVSGAEITANLHGVSVEVFDFAEPLSAMPPLPARAPDRIVVASAINLRNPNLIFGADPFGFGTGSHATRLTATLEPIAAAATEYTFTLGVNAGGRLSVNGNLVVDIPTSTGQFQQASGTIVPRSGPIAIEILAFDNGNPEVQLLVQASGYDIEVPEPDALTPALVPYRTTSGATGAFSIAGVPTILGDIGVSASAVNSAGRTLNGKAAPVPPVPSGVTDVGAVRLVDFSTLYGAAFTGPTGPASLYEIDPATGAATLIGPIGFWRVGAMDVASDGTLYAVGRDPVTRRNVLLTIDRQTGAGTKVGPTGVEFLGYGDTMGDISFRPSDGVLFGYLEAGDGLGTIDLATGAATALGRTFVSCCGNGIAFDPDGRLLHANERELHVLDQITGAATTLAPLIYPNIGFPRMSSMDYQPGTGELVGFLKSDAGTFLASVDAVSGVVTIIGAATVNGLDAIAWGPPR